MREILSSGDIEEIATSPAGGTPSAGRHDQGHKSNTTANETTERKEVPPALTFATVSGEGQVDFKAVGR